MAVSTKPTETYALAAPSVMEAMTAIVRLRADEAQFQGTDDLPPISHERALKLARVIYFASQLPRRYLEHLLLDAEMIWERNYGELCNDRRLSDRSETRVRLMADVIEALAFPEDAALGEA